MAQTALQAEVSLRTLRTAQERRILQHPAEIRGGEVRSITIHVPLLSGQNDYLVVRMPDRAVRDLLTQATSLPLDQRAQYIRGWISRNQQAILDQYISSGGTVRRFRYDIVPVQAPRLSETTPRRTEEARQPAPVSTAVPRREEAASPPAAPRGRVIQPGGTSRTGAPPLPAPRVEDRPVERPVPAAPRTARIEIPPNPEEIRGGNGTQRRPYAVYRTDAEVERIRRRRTETVVEWPFQVDIEGVGMVHFRAYFSEAQLASGARGRTQSDLWRIVRATFAHVAAERPGARLENTALRSATGGFNRGFARMVAEYERASEE